MIAPLTLRNWTYRFVFVAISIAAVLVYLMPIEVGARRLPGPDLTLALAFAWVLRRPAYVPPLLVGIVMLIGDIMFVRPPGLWAALTVVGLEFLRRREPHARDIAFVFEWALVGAVMLAMAVAYRLVLAITLTDQVSLGLAILQQLSTIAAYPAVVLVSHLAFGIVKITPHEAEELKALAR